MRINLFLLKKPISRINKNQEEIVITTMIIFTKIILPGNPKILGKAI
jgi:hypothetical protein